MISKIDKPNVLLASFPRSGNTFLRNVLYEVYGAYSWNNLEVYEKNLKKFKQLSKKGREGEALSKKQELKRDELRQKFKFKILKSHDLPKKVLPYCAKKTLVVYLVRDGRDALVSMAHHRMDITEPGTEFLPNLKEALKASFGTYFGGWGKNVERWSERADFIFRFEDFIADPIKYTELLRSQLNMPEPIIERLPTFESQKTSHAHFGGNARSNYSEEQRQQFNAKFFRKGQVGSWKEEMPEDIHQMFWKKYGKIMMNMGYSKDGRILDFSY